MNTIPMPVVRPVPIPTGGAGFWGAIKIWLKEPRQWEVVDDYTIFIPGIGKIFINAGFVFDGASIPRLLWFFLSPTGLLFIPGLVHDYGYRYDKLTTVDLDGVVTTYYSKGQKFWDGLFLDIAIYVNGMAGLNKLAWLSLRAFGRMAWGKHRRAEITG